MAAAFGVLAALVSASCGGLPRTHYYTLRMLPLPPAHDPKTTFVLGVERFRASEALRGDRIVYYESPTQLNFYEYHRWSAVPATMLSEQAARQLESMGLFAQIRLLPSREPVDYILQGHLLNFEEVDYEGGKGRAALQLKLVRARDHKVVWSVMRQAERPIQGKGVPGVVSALNDSADQLLREALAALAAEVEREFVENSGKSQ